MAPFGVDNLRGRIENLVLERNNQATSADKPLTTQAAGPSRIAPSEFIFGATADSPKLSTVESAQKSADSFVGFLGSNPQGPLARQMANAPTTNFEAAFSPSPSTSPKPRVILKPKLVKRQAAVPAANLQTTLYRSDEQANRSGQFDASYDITDHTSKSVVLEKKKMTPFQEGSICVEDPALSSDSSSTRRSTQERESSVFKKVPESWNDPSDLVTRSSSCNTASIALNHESSKSLPKSSPSNVVVRPRETEASPSNRLALQKSYLPRKAAKLVSYPRDSLSGSAASDSDEEVSDSSSAGGASESGEDSAADVDESSGESKDAAPHVRSKKIEEQLSYHPSLLQRLPGEDDLNEIRSSPLFTQPVWNYARSLSAGSQNPAFTQYALLGANSNTSGSVDSRDAGIFYNITAPSSIFICGNQGSGKSHTLSCFLENCLIPSKRLGCLPRPLTGVVFHYDTFISDVSGTPCEAAYLATHPMISVRVLCAPTNIRTMKRVYSKFPNVVVEELKLKESDLNTKRMLDLMAVGSGSVPLYIHVIQRVLRDMRIEQQGNGQPFSYARFKRMIDAEGLTPMQAVPLQQRLETLESFMVKQQAYPKSREVAHGNSAPHGTDWTPEEGQLTIVDLSCPCVTPEMACSLFNICLSLFLEQKNPSIGRIAALDEAHKYMGDSAESQTLTNSLLSTIRLQRHLALRVIISTQEPTVSPKLLDLCSITVVHRFQSPDWLQVLKRHLAGLSTASQILIQDAQRRKERGEDDLAATITFDGVKGISIAPQDPALEMMSHIVKLRTGEALVFAPSAIVGIEKKRGTDGGESVVVPRRLDHEVMRVRIRARITADGGKSVMAS